MTEFVFKYIRKNRELFLDLVNSLSIEQLNKIPDGFNNNIAWNFGHIVVSTQSLCYIRSGIKPDLEIPLKAKYGKDSKPESFITQQEIDELKNRMVATINMIEEDVNNNVFKKITPYSTATYAHEMHSIDEILTCTLAHDSLHFGYALAQRKLVI
ncbi:MAG: DinB family protein [Parafilimonas sp.]